MKDRMVLRLVKANAMICVLLKFQICQTKFQYQIVNETVFLCQHIGFSTTNSAQNVQHKMLIGKFLV